MESSYFDQLSELVGMEVRINRGGPDSVAGVLLSVQKDYLVVQTMEAVVYINGFHIKSVSELNEESADPGFMAHPLRPLGFRRLLDKLRGGRQI